MDAGGKAQQEEEVVVLVVVVVVVVVAVARTTPLRYARPEEVTPCRMRIDTASSFVEACSAVQL